MASSHSIPGRVQYHAIIRLSKNASRLALVRGGLSVIHAHQHPYNAIHVPLFQSARNAGLRAGLEILGANKPPLCDIITPRFGVIVGGIGGGVWHGS
jgi:hypothetical protein